ncbi:MAG: hypothetical protein AAF916_12850, partial [Planctomycetota bacterium]
RSGGFLEAGNDFQRTEQLADINNTSTSGGNHGWATFATTLTDAGFTVTQIEESVEAFEPTTGQTQGTAVPLATMDLSQYDTIIFGSNNATYDTADVNAVESYLRSGGGAVFISDANFGSNWADASNSDQPFLDRLGLTANQDRGTYSLTRNNGEFLVDDHPILEGVNQFDGEGVTPVTVNGTLPVGVAVEILARAEGQVRRNDGTSGNFQGSSSNNTEDDAVLLAGTIDDGRFVWHFDRNTFFNLNGAGTNITRFDNARLATNILGFTTTPIPEPTSAAILIALTTIMTRRGVRQAPRA